MTSTSVTIGYPIAFSSAVLNVVPYDESNTAENTVAVCITSKNTTNFTMGAKSVASGVAWVALGY